MVRNPIVRLFLIFVIVFLAVWVDTRDKIEILNPFNPDALLFERDVRPRLGLDLRGGLQVVMEADLPETTAVDAEQMQVAKQIIESRTNALGVSENMIQVAGERRLVGEFPGLEDVSSVLATLQQTGLLEFVDMGSSPVPVGTVVATDFGITPSETGVTPTPTPTMETLEATLTINPTLGGGESPAPTVATTPSLTTEPNTPTATTNGQEPTSTPTSTEAAESTTGTPEATAEALTPSPTPTTEAEAEPAYLLHTVMTGQDLKSAVVQQNEVGGYYIAFTLTDEGRQIFAEYTSTHVGQTLGIVLDKTVISTPVVDEAIPNGAGIIQSSSFTKDSANALVVQLRYGSLPIPLKIVETRIIGPTLGEDSLQKSLIAGLIGMIIVFLFMGLYYRLPGIVADVSILIYAVTAFAIFKYIPVTLTLPGIAGFLLSTGSALDANILFFERIKEELHSGLSLSNAIDKGWKRAWPSIRDSNIATLITSGILAWFGKTFGATIVLGFSVTLALGVFISLLTAWFVTRSLLSLVLQWLKINNYVRWFGI